jgi:hypothetical protein
MLKDQDRKQLQKYFDQSIFQLKTMVVAPIVLAATTDQCDPGAQDRYP